MFATRPLFRSLVVSIYLLRKTPIEDLGVLTESGEEFRAKGTSHKEANTMFSTTADTNTQGKTIGSAESTFFRTLSNHRRCALCASSTTQMRLQPSHQQLLRANGSSFREGVVFTYGVYEFLRSSSDVVGALGSRPSGWIFVNL